MNYENMELLAKLQKADPQEKLAYIGDCLREELNSRNRVDAAERKLRNLRNEHHLLEMALNRAVVVLTMKEMQVPPVGEEVAK